MAKQKDPVGTSVEQAFPLRGIDVSNPFDLQPPGTTPEAVNVRAFDPGGMRARGGSRPGLERYLTALPTGSVIQHLDFIVDPQAEALTADTSADLDSTIDYIDDPSTNNHRNRNPGRRVRRGGSGRQSNINIAKSEVTIYWSNPANIVVGTALGGTQLNAQAYSGIIPVPGTFVYSPTAGAVLPLGDGQPLATQFTPTNATAYRTASKTVYINVVQNKVVTHIDASNPGTLHATTATLQEQGISAVGRDPTNGEVAGTMTYSPLRSTTPSQPSVTVTYTFTPDDTAHYESASLTVTYPVDGTGEDITGSGPIASHTASPGIVFTAGTITVNEGAEDEYTVDGITATWDPLQLPELTTEANVYAGQIVGWRYSAADEAWYTTFSPF